MHDEGLALESNVTFAESVTWVRQKVNNDINRERGGQFTHMSNKVHPLI